MDQLGKKKFNKRLRKFWENVVFYNGSCHIMKGKKVYNHYIFKNMIQLASKLKEEFYILLLPCLQIKGGILHFTPSPSDC